IWDAAHGKKAVTEWQNLGIETYNAPDGAARRVTRVLFTPLTGRTHQLRLASADKHGFGIPIIGDSLYGTRADGERLMLQAKTLEFTHPITGRRMMFGLTDEF
ncbi:MAG: RluA family pseudouridine synthase, partial [Treponema sp.]